MKKKIMMIMPVMKGGGAERVAAQLMNEFHRKGCEVKFLLTSSGKEEVIRTDLKDEIPLVLLQEEIADEKISISSKVLRVLSSLLCKPYEMLGKAVPAKLAYISFISQCGREVRYIREQMKADPDLNVISFLQPSIPMTVLAGQGLSNKIVISERGNPERLMNHRYGRNFIEKYYDNVSAVVFQTKYAKGVYPKNISEKGVVISNPIKNDLPMPYARERNKYITTFCRISKQKNLPLLVRAFVKLHKEYPEYKLKIIGDTFNREGEEVKAVLEEMIMNYGIQSSVEFLPFMESVHSEIIEDAMYVNSSDYEGISNAMLEAMAIGLPVVCTDCPIGGAKATIENEVNGMLVPAGNVDAVYNAMKKIIENEKLSNKLSKNSVKLREQLSLEQIASKWLEII